MHVLLQTSVLVSAVGSLYVPACTGSWIVGGPIDPGETVTLRVLLRDKANELMTEATYKFNTEVFRAFGDRPFTPPSITSSATVGTPGSIDFVVKMQTAGVFVFKITSQAGDEQIEGSPFQFTVKTGKWVGYQGCNKVCTFFGSGKPQIVSQLFYARTSLSINNCGEGVYLLL